LVGAGVGKITIVDNDLVSLSNLHRQTLFREADVSTPKVEAAFATLSLLNSDCTIETAQEAVTPKNAAHLVGDNTLVLDCADSFAVSYILSDTCMKHNTPLFSASVLGFEGYVAGFCAGAPSLRAVFPDLPERAQTCATTGVMGPVVGMLGAAQAQMALAQIIGQSPSPLGQMINFNMKTMRSSAFRFDQAPDPSADLTFISPADVDVADFTVDLRDINEAPLLVKPWAQRISVDQFKHQSQAPETGQRAIFTCRSGLRAWQAALHLRSYWDGEILLISMGDTPETERQKT
jgi:molybdopterin/thiamine biosynthesis adenylyltransferase